MTSVWTASMKKTSLLLLSTALLLMAGTTAPLGNTASADTAAAPKRQMEYLDRGLVAVKAEQGVFVSWRMLGTEPDAVMFNLYRNGRKINAAPLASSTSFSDPEGTLDSVYFVRAVVSGVEQLPSAPVRVWGDNHLRVPLQKPADGMNPDGSVFTYSANDASVGDLDGDGKYEIVLKWDPSNSKDNSQDGVTGAVYVDAYKLDGARLWRIDLGRNIRAGAHYTQLMVYDLDGDGKAEVAMKTADGTTDGIGKVIGDPNADYRDLTGARPGRVLSGPEFLTVFAGNTGKELVTTDYDPPRGKVTDWGDNYGNRVDRFLACIAYLDGVRPSLIMARGYYTRTVLVAYNWRDGQLTKLWKFDSDNAGYESYVGQGNHNLSAADVDGDGKDEIVYGAMTVDDNGNGLYNTGLGHGDALHVGDLDPTRPGLEVFKVLENKPYGAAVWDAATGQVLWRVTGRNDTGRGVSADIDPNYPGEEVWASAGVGLYTIQGTKISSNTPSMNFAIWWDGDLLRELLDGNRIDKWDYTNQTMINLLTAAGDVSNNGTKATPALQADLFGDWREEAVWRTSDSSALEIFTTTAVTEHRFRTLMHDPIYRLGVAWQNVAYNQPPHPSFFLGNNMAAPAAPNIAMTIPAAVRVQPKVLNLKSQGDREAVTAAINLPYPFDAKLIDGRSTVMVVNSHTIAAQLQRPSDEKDRRDDQGQGDDRNEGGDGARYATLKFDRQQVVDAIRNLNGDITVRVEGTLTDGNRFTGTDTIRVTH